MKFCILTVTLLMATTVATVADMQLYKLGDGPLTVANVDTLVLHDDARDKSLQLRVTFPQQPGSYPLILFSHGASGSKNGYQPLVRYWVSHGYVCIQPTHGDSLSLMSRDERRKFGSLQEYVTSSGVGKHWRSRPEDIAFILDSLDDIEGKIADLAGKIDKSRIGVGGHSYGAHTTQMVAGLALKMPLVRRRVTVSDPRPQAFLMISPQGTGRTIDAESYQNMTRPALMITGTQDDSPRGGDYKWRLEAWENVPPGDKYLLFVKDAHHNFGGISGVRYPGAGPNNADHVNYVKTASLAFWDAYLKQDPAALGFLQSDQMKTVTGGEAEIRTKLPQ